MSRFQRKLHPDCCLHVTGRCNNREHFPIPLASAWELFSDYLHLIHGQFNIRIHAFVLMPNHYHLICRDPDLHLSRAMEFLMRQTSKEMGELSGRINRIWGSPFHSSVMMSPLHSLHAYKYNYRNPVAAGICRHVENYQWSTLQILLGQRKGIIPLEKDELLFQNVEKTLEWLNADYKKQEAIHLHRGLRKKIFKLVADDRTKKKNSLESWDSVPFYAPGSEMLGGTFDQM